MSRPPQDPTFDSNRNIRAIEALQQNANFLAQTLNTTYAEQIEILRELIRARLELGQYGAVLEAGEQFKVALGFVEVPDVSMTISCYLGMATAFRERQESSDASAYYLKVETLLDQLDLSIEANRKIQIGFYRDFGIFCLTQKQYQQAAILFSQGVTASSREPKAHLALRSYHCLATGLARNFKFAIPTLLKVRAEWNSISDRDTSMDYGSHLYHTARVLEKLAKQLEVAGKHDTATEQLKSAIANLEESIEIRKKLIETSIGAVYTNSRLADPCWLLGKILISVGKIEKGKESLRQAVACYKTMGSEPAAAKAAQIETKWLAEKPTRISIFSSPQSANVHVEDAEVATLTQKM